MKYIKQRFLYRQLFPYLVLVFCFLFGIFKVVDYSELTGMYGLPLDSKVVKQVSFEQFPNFDQVKKLDQLILISAPDEFGTSFVYDPDCFFEKKSSRMVDSEGKIGYFNINDYTNVPDKTVYVSKDIFRTIDHSLVIDNPELEKEGIKVLVPFSRNTKMSETDLYIYSPEKTQQNEALKIFKDNEIVDNAKNYPDIKQIAAAIIKQPQARMVLSVGILFTLFFNSIYSLRPKNISVKNGESDKEFLFRIIIEYIFLFLMLIAQKMDKLTAFLITAEIVIIYEAGCFLIRAFFKFLSDTLNRQLFRKTAMIILSIEAGLLILSSAVLLTALLNSLHRADFSESLFIIIGIIAPLFIVLYVTARTVLIQIEKLDVNHQLLMLGCEALLAAAVFGTILLKPVTTSEYLVMIGFAELMLAVVIIFLSYFKIKKIDKYNNITFE